MTRVLRRPMFRLGGNTDQGIMSGVVPRQGYAEAGMAQDYNEKLALLNKVAMPPDRSRSDFMIDWGLGMVSGTPRGNILATAAEQAKEPFDKYRQAQAQRGAMGTKLGLTAAESAMAQSDKLKQIAAQTSPDAGMRNVFLEKAINDGYDLPEAQRIADYQIMIKAELQEKVGRNRLGGILNFDVSDEKTMKKRMPKLREHTGKFFFDPYDGLIKELVNEGGKLFFRPFNSVAEITFAPDDAPTVVDEKFMGEPVYPPEYMGGA